MTTRSLAAIFAGVGIVCAFAAALTGPPLLNATIGPSYNTINLCKELERKGYLSDECFDEYGLLKLECYRRPKGGGA